MNLQELKKAVDSAVEMAVENDDKLDEISVSLQIDRHDKDSIWSSDEVEVHYDGNMQASGCVITAFKGES